MSVIVMGMEMPALCQECDLYIDGACYAKGYRDYRSIMDMSKPADCPLIEVPTPPEPDFDDVTCDDCRYSEKFVDGLILCRRTKTSFRVSATSTCGKGKREVTE